VVWTRWEECGGVCYWDSGWFSFWKGRLHSSEVWGLADEQTSVARAILQQLDHIPTVLILSQDSFYRRHTPEEIKLAFDNDLDLGE
jgi:hypothetical protein